MRTRSVVVCVMALLGVLAQAQERGAYTNSIGMDFVEVPAGSFVMGRFQPECAAVGAQGNVTEEQYEACLQMARKAAREGFKVTIGKPFYIGKFEVTQEQYEKVMGVNPSYHTAAILGEAAGKYPVESVKWSDAQAFVRKLNAIEKTNVYRLPTEAEWEYAARAGAEGDTQGAKAPEIAWFMNNANYRTHPVGQKLPNAWGIHDMLGNVWEWVQDWYDNDVVPTRPQGPSKGTEHVLKGGGFHAHSKNIRVTVHAGGPGSVISTGFRVVMEKR